MTTTTTCARRFLDHLGAVVWRCQELPHPTGHFALDDGGRFCSNCSAAKMRELGVRGYKSRKQLIRTHLRDRLAKLGIAVHAGKDCVEQEGPIRYRYDMIAHVKEGATLDPSEVSKYVRPAHQSKDPNVTKLRCVVIEVDEESHRNFDWSDTTHKYHPTQQLARTQTMFRGKTHASANHPIRHLIRVNAGLAKERELQQQGAKQIELFVILASEGSDRASVFVRPGCEKRFDEYVDTIVCRVVRALVLDDRVADATRVDYVEYDEE